MADDATSSAPVTAEPTEPISNPGNLLADATTGEQPAEPQTPEADAPGDKGEGDKPAAKAPKEYADFNLPEGVTVDPEQVTEFKALAKELDLTQDGAQKLVDKHVAAIKAAAEAPYNAWNELQTKWQAEVKADPELGGTHMADTLKASAEVFKPSPSNPIVKTEAEATALRQALNLTGAGNNPEIIRVFARLGRAMSEPGSTRGLAPNKSEKSAGEMLYPGMSAGND